MKSLLAEQVGFYITENIYMKPDDCRGIKNFFRRFDGERIDKENGYHPIEK